MSNGYTKEEEAFLTLNYSKLGAKICAQKINRTETAVKHKASRLKLTKPNPATSSKVNIRSIVECSTPEAAYILGLLWADGYIRHNQIRLEVLHDDAVEFIKYSI